ncbi:MAG: GNAT family N-acetyltransferase [Caldilineaceae bacterium]
MSIPQFQIIDMSRDNASTIQQAAELLITGFAQMAPEAWPTMPDALEEVTEALEPGKTARAAVNDNGLVLGWIGGAPRYSGNTWELHPLVVHPGYRKLGIGRALVADLERLAHAAGAYTLSLGTDDEMNLTSLGGVNLYPNVWEHVANIRNLNDHPYEFYQKLGFVITGVLPDANGPGKPDIFMAKRVRKY